MNIMFNTTSVSSLTDKQILIVTWCSGALSVFAFAMLSITFYKLMLYIFKF